MKKKRKRKKTASHKKQPLIIKIQPGMSEISNGRKIADIEVRVQNQQLPYGPILDEEQRRRQKCLNLAIKFRVPLSFAIENYDILSEQDT